MQVLRPMTVRMSCALTPLDRWAYNAASSSTEAVVAVASRAPEPAVQDSGTDTATSYR